MINFDKIISKQNPKVKFVVKLRDRSKRKRFKMFIVEGFRELTRALNNNIVCEFLFFCPKFFRDHNFITLVYEVYKANVPVFEVTPEIFKKISVMDGCDGILGVCRTWETDINDIVLSDNPLILVVDGIEKSGNLGALIRSAESVNVDAMIICNPVTDIFNHNVVRTSQGALFSLPVILAEECIVRNFLIEKRMQMLATTPSTSTCYWNVDMRNPLAIVVGSEHNGLSDFWLKDDCVVNVSIPQFGHSDSLNVNDAAVVVMYEAMRQRYQNKI